MLLYLFLPTLLACGHHTPREAVTDSQRVTRADTSYGRYRRDSDYSDHPERYKRFNAADYPVFATRSMGRYLVTVLQYKQGPETNPDGSPPPPRAIDAQYILVLKDQEKGRTDTLVLDITDIEEQQRLTVKDITKDLGFNNLIFRLDWEGEDDNDFTKVYGYKGDTLAELFDAGTLEDMKRKNKDTLYGHCQVRSDLLSLTEDDIITVSLPDYNVDVHPPDTTVFDYPTHTNDTVHALRITKNTPRGVPFTILPGTPLTIDTFFRRTQMITFHLADSIFLRATFDQLETKVQGDDAG